ncbi:Hypothetical predicted protein [Cloeon dipterum]|uniref:CHK kinase-like domain-containing protein n=1 Tax=Cloeon dipterum TaxID=197152 RepID=A0A8S1BQ34_9INSE|nr:Hypothetical predicted protein [Cloeon dipterum]
MSSDDKKSLVHPGDLLAAVRTRFGPDARIIDYQVVQGTETIQGFASLMLRAKVKVEDGDQKREINFMVKRTPVVALHAEMLASMGNVVEREGIFFDTLLPILEERSPSLPVVKALVCHKDALIMEDLCDKGFKTVAKDFGEMGRGALTLPIARMSFRQLAKLHAASLDIDWKQVAPPGFFAQDILMEGKAAEQFGEHFGKTIEMVIIPILRKIKPDLPGLEKYVEFLRSKTMFDNMIPFTKYDEANGPNLLLHADFHLNNTMFKLSEDGTPQDMRFIDFQILRYAPPYTDLVNFLYTGTNNSFRVQHEKDLIRIYIEAFNAAANRTPDLLDFDTFYTGYDNARYYGVVFALGAKPMLLMSQLNPDAGGEVTEEIMEAMQNTDLSAPAMAFFDNDPVFKQEMEELIEHTIEVFKRYVSIE